MFSKIRNRLTILYAVVMTIFLLAFIAVSYAGILWVLHREEQQDIQAFTQEEVKEHVMMLKRKESRIMLKDDDNANNIGGKIFFYVFDNDGKLVDTEEPVVKMRSKVRDMISSWQDTDGEGNIKKFHIADGERVILIMCSMPIYDGQELLGRVYVGEDITSYYEILKNLLIVLIVISILFLIAAVFVGHLLAGRVIVPINNSFSRQREFVANASHELRTPLSILLTSVEVVQSDDDNHLSSFSTQVLDDMKSEVRRITKMVSDLLTLARADAGATNIIKEKFDLYTVTQQIIRSFQPVADEKTLELGLDCENNIVVFADKERINQLLLILLDNAIKYTPPGGRIDIVIRMIEGPKPSVRIIVQDKGVGIPAAHQNLIFDRFYRVDKVRSREEGGTGIGLSIAKWIVDAHEGSISVESTPGYGSSFIVNLPI
ncbi:sensor histidine kinase [Pelosinus sp. sgz500959]|uniref:sensor histidine kinase n=1 Tax=Pelosinus sp. sgz500959 TaxID=3242472 RepID=UPI00366F741D